MTLDDVMKLEGRELDAAVAERIHWVGEPWKYSPIDGMPFDRPFPPPVPEFHRDWDAAMQVREWARGLKDERQTDWVWAVTDCMLARLEYKQRPYPILETEPIDFARAALLVSP